MAFESSVDIDASPETLFDLTQDYGRRLEWDPYLKEARLVDADVAAHGARAWCVAKTTGLGMETQYVSFKRPQTAAINMTRGPFFLSRFAGSWNFKALASGQTRVVFRYHIETRPKWLQFLLMPVVGWVFARDSARRLAALKTFVEGQVS